MTTLRPLNTEITGISNLKNDLSITLFVIFPPPSDQSLELPMQRLKSPSPANYSLEARLTESMIVVDT